MLLFSTAGILSSPLIVSRDWSKLYAQSYATCSLLSLWATRADTKHVGDPSKTFNFMLTLESVQTSSCFIHSPLYVSLNPQSHLLPILFKRLCPSLYWKGRNHPVTSLHYSDLLPIISFLIRPCLRPCDIYHCFLIFFMANFSNLLKQAEWLLAYPLCDIEFLTHDFNETADEKVINEY